MKLTYATLFFISINAFAYGTGTSSAPQPTMSGTESYPISGATDAYRDTNGLDAPLAERRNANPHVDSSPRIHSQKMEDRKIKKDVMRYKK